jgi:DNA polymerase III subunit alpha
MREYWDKEVPGASDSTLLIAERVESYEDVFTHQDRMPRFAVPDGYDEAGWLHHEVMRGLERRLSAHIPAAYRERATYELDVIVDKGFPGYFLIAADLMDHAREVGIRVGPAVARPRGPWSRTRSASPASTRSNTACCSNAS